VAWSPRIRGGDVVTSIQFAWDRYVEPGGTWCQADDSHLRIWSQHGIPADPSTLEYALGLMFRLWREHQALLDAVRAWADSEDPADDRRTEHDLGAALDAYLERASER
jgi:hypothetical protein